MTDYYVIAGSLVILAAGSAIWKLRNYYPHYTSLECQHADHRACIGPCEECGEACRCHCHKGA